MGAIKLAPSYCVGNQQLILRYAIIFWIRNYRLDILLPDQHNMIYDIPCVYVVELLCLAYKNRAALNWWYCWSKVHVPTFDCMILYELGITHIITQLIFIPCGSWYTLWFVGISGKTQLTLLIHAYYHWSKVLAQHLMLMELQVR